MSEQSESAGTSVSSATSKQIRDILERYRLPGFDIEAFIQARNSDIDSIARATVVAFKGAQTITEKQADLLKATLDELNAALSLRPSAPGGASTEDSFKKQSDLLQTAIDRALADMKQMAETVQRAQQEIFDIGLERARSNAEQLRSLFVNQKK